MRRSDMGQPTKQRKTESNEAPGRLLIRELRLQNFLSFGPDAEPVQLRALNVLIGPNGSGKSNFIEGLSLLRAAPTDLARPIREGGGVGEWIHKRAQGSPATVQAIVAYPEYVQGVRHVLSFTEESQLFRLADERITPEEGQRFRLADEQIAHLRPEPGKPHVFFYGFQNGRPTISVNGERRPLELDEAELDDSILSLRNDPELYPEITYLGRQYRRIRIYREWAFGRNTVFRQPQRADMRNDRLQEDFSNLGLFLNRLRRNPPAKNAILRHLHDLYKGADDFDVSVEGGTVQVFFTEGDFTIPATRLSDGTLRYLCLLAILCDPKPPPLVCVEEPELGLHPDILPGLADLLVEASSRMQLIVTTHSDMLIDALTSTPESVLVCEKHDGQTQIERLDPNALKGWLDKYRLGQLWMKGHLGGTRW